jgi:hypothetical protein
MLAKRGFPKDATKVDQFGNNGPVIVREANEETMLCAVQDYYNTELVDDWPYYADFWVYTESTKDGYEVFVATHNRDRISVNEDIHYYENDLAGELKDAIANGGKIYVDDLDAYYVTEAVQNCYLYLRDRLTEEIENELINDGYVREEETKNT